MVDEFEVDDTLDLQKRRQIGFIGKQLLASDSKRYSTDNMADAIHLYLRSRNSYRALRKMLVLPCRNTVRDYFGKRGLVGGSNECKRTVHNDFSTFNDGQKDCYISFDEIHVKPGLQFQGKYVLGNALNTNEPLPAKTILAVMINPSYGAPAFVARLVPVLKLKGDILFNIV